jgi:uncharacterized protein (TIGR01244 family)
MDRFQISDKLYVGRSQPSEQDLQRLAADGFASIIDLRQHGEGADDLSPPLEAAAAGRNGLRYAHIPIPTDRVEPEMFDRVAAALKDMPGPVLVHCASGKRSGTFAIACAAIENGSTGRAAIERIDAAGASYGSDAMRAAVRRHVDRKAGRVRLEAAQPARPAHPAAATAPLLRQLPSTTMRVAQNTPDEINRRIARDIDASIRWHALHPAEIGRRLDELEREWDIERVLEANAATIALGGVLLGAMVDRRWLVLPAAVTAFLLQHAIQGWCPPVPMFRRIGIRTAAEIDRERYALKALRGDFVAVRGDSAPARARQASAAVAQ